MATRSFVLRQNPDKTFSGRYHHWDGYVDGLGLFLNNHLETWEKVNWLFELNSSFSSVFHARQSHLKEREVTPYPDEFKISNAEVLLEYAPEFVFDNETWDVCNQKCHESYTYLYTNNTWHVVIDQKSNFKETKYIAVETYKILSDLALVLEDDMEKTLENIKNQRQAHKNFTIINQTSLDKAMINWTTLTPDILQCFKHNVLTENYDYRKDEVEQIDQLCHAFAQKKALKKATQSSKTQKKARSRPRQL